MLKYKRKVGSVKILLMVFLILLNQTKMDGPELVEQYIAIIIAEVKNSSRQLYPLTKNYSMCLLPVGTKKLIIYQLESLLSIKNLAKIVIIVEEEETLVQQYIQSSFLPAHRDYPHRIEFSVAKDCSNTFSAVKNVLKDIKVPHSGYLLLHADTINSVSLQDVLTYHETKNSDLTLLVKAKRELGELEKKLPEGQVETEIDNVLLGEDNKCLFMDMADEIDNSGVNIDPTIFRQVRKAVFKRVVDSKTYIFNEKVASIIRNLSSEEIYEVKPWLIQLFVQNQTNKKLLELINSSEEVKPLRIYAHFNEQDTYIRKINSKKIYETLNFDSIIRGQKQKDILLPTAFSEKIDEKKQYKGSANVAQSAIIGASSRIRRSCVGSGCKIGKNVELINSIILQNVEIKDGCRISESIIGRGSFIGEGAIIKNTYSESNCRVADGMKIQSEVLIRNE